MGGKVGHPNYYKGKVFPGDKCKKCGSDLSFGRRADKARIFWCRQCGKRKMLLHKLSKKFHITIEQYETLVLKQNGECAICKEQMKTIFIDHDHATGKVRGLLCVRCNSMLGHARDKIEVLRAGISYLQA